MNDVFIIRRAMSQEVDVGEDRTEQETDPVAALLAAGMPAATAEPLLQAPAVRDEVLAKLPEVVAHRNAQLPLKARLLILLLGSTAVAEKIRAATGGA